MILTIPYPCRAGARATLEVALKSWASCHVLEDTEGASPCTPYGKLSPAHLTSPSLLLLPWFAPLNRYNGCTSKRSPQSLLSLLLHPPASASPAVTGVQNLRGKRDPATFLTPCQQREEPIMEGTEAPVPAPSPQAAYYSSQKPPSLSCTPVPTSSPPAPSPHLCLAKSQTFLLALMEASLRSSRLG